MTTKVYDIVYSIQKQLKNNIWKILKDSGLNIIMYSQSGWFTKDTEATTAERGSPIRSTIAWKSVDTHPFFTLQPLLIKPPSPESMLLLNGFSVQNCSNGYSQSKLTGEDVALNFQSNPECVSLVARSVAKHFALDCRCKIIEARQRPTATLLLTWVPRFWESTQGLYTGSHPSSYITQSYRASHGLILTIVWIFGKC